MSGFNTHSLIRLGIHRSSAAPSMSMGDELSQKAKKLVPRFASFKSKAQVSSKDGCSKGAEKNAHSATADMTVIDRHTPKIDHVGIKSRHEHRSSCSQNYHHNRSTRDRERSLLLPPPSVEPSSGEEAPDLFLVDKVGDPKNLTYGFLDRCAIPDYFRSGAGSVIGSTPGNRIVQYIGGDKAMVLSVNRHSLLSKRDKNSFPRLNRVSTRKLLIKSDKRYDHNVDAAADFLPLRLASGKERRVGGNGNTLDSSASSEGSLDHYRSIEGKAKAANRSDDENLLYGSDTFVSDYDGGQLDRSDDAKQRKKIEVARKTEVDPSNGDAWLELINQQDEVLGIGFDSLESNITNAERQSNADIKISIYEKAIEQVMDPKVREKLLLGMMEEGSKIWENSKLSSKWRSLLCTYPEYLGLWLRYLDYKQTAFSSFRYEEARSVYLDCLGVLQRARSTSRATTAEGKILYENQVYVLLRMVVFMREAGFTENAVAIWQAVVEWQVFRPDRFQSREYALAGPKASEALSAFEEFWESEVPRIGEKGFEGWARFMTDNGAPAREPPPPQKDFQYTPEDATELSIAWARSERRRFLQSRLVARTIDQVDESDPYRVILTSDVRDSLIAAPASLSGLMLLFQSLLAFCHLPPFPTEHTDNCTRLWWRDQFLRNEVLHQSYKTLSAWQVQDAGYMSGKGPGSDGIAKSVSLNVPYQPDPFSFPMPDYQTSLDTLFAARGSWFSAFDAWQHEYSGDRGPVEIAWIRRLLHTLVQYAPSGDCLGEYYLALEVRVAPETAKKVAKALIKKRPDSLRLYNAYALIEYRLGHVSDAENVLATAINMGTSLQEAAQRDTVLLWRTWIWELLRLGRTSQALGRLLTYSEEVINVNLPEQNPTATSASLLLRTRTVLTSARDHLLFLALPNHALLHADLLILLTYLTTASLSSCLSTFHQNANLFPSFSPAHELLHQTFAKLLYHHAMHTPSFSPSVVRSPLAESIKAYPKNTIFLSLYAWIESRFRIDDRVRSIIKDVVLASRPSPERKEDPPSIISHFFAVYTELRRSVTLGSSNNAIRATFERAVREDSIGAHSAGLWKLYFLFERETGGGKKAREVFWRGIRACPWAKELYLLAFDGEGEMPMAETELRGVVEMMEEKELRFHKRIEDVRQELAARKGLLA